MFGIEVDLILAVVAVWGLWTIRVALEAHSQGFQKALREWDDGRVETLESVQGELIASVTRLEAEVDRLPHTWDEMHKKVRRTEERTRGAVERAMAELEEHGLESRELNGIAREIRDGDEGGVDPRQLSLLPEGVGDVPAPRSQNEDWQAATLAYKYGRR